MPDVQIHPLGTEAAPATWPIPDSAELVLRMARASFDGSAAAGAFKPCLRIISDAGSIAGEAVADDTIAAGASADVSWFPFVGKAAAAAVASTQAVLTAEQFIATSQTFVAGTTNPVTWDAISADPSGTFNVGLGHGASWKLNKTGTYLIAFQMLPSPSWPSAASGPVLFRPDVPVDIIPYSQTNSYTPGSINIGGFTAVVSTFVGVPATVSIQINNQSGTNFSSIGGGPANNGTALVMAYLGPEVLVP